jgi:hypothetical protein
MTVSRVPVTWSDHFEAVTDFGAGSAIKGPVRPRHVFYERWIAFGQFVTCKSETCHTGQVTRGLSGSTAKGIIRAQHLQQSELQHIVLLSVVETQC